MTTSRHRDRHRLFLAAVFMTVMLSITMQGEIARAASLTPDGYRIGTAVEKFDDTWQIAATYRLRPPRRLRSSHLELAIGTNMTSTETHAFVSLGPVWYWSMLRDRMFVGLGFSPTVLFGSTFNGRDMGGNVHFTSSASIGAKFGRRRALSIALRIQHTSNGGLNGTNPGMDVVGLSYHYDFGR